MSTKTNKPSKRQQRLANTTKQTKTTHQKHKKEKTYPTLVISGNEKETMEFYQTNFPIIHQYALQAKSYLIENQLQICIDYSNLEFSLIKLKELYNKLENTSKINIHVMELNNKSKIIRTHQINQTPHEKR